jgi:adenosylcobyric acid synthase
VVVVGYEIHQGVTCAAGAVPLLTSVREAERDGAVTSVATFTPAGDCEGASGLDGRVGGTYLHGLFDAPGVVPALVRALCPSRAPGLDLDAAAPAGGGFDRLARHFREHLDLARILSIARGG